MKITFPSHLSDAELAASLTVRAGREREATSHFIADIASAFPLILDMLEDGRLSLATVRAAASRKSRRQVEQLLAHRFPQPDVLPLIRKLPMPTASLPTGDPAPAVVEARGWRPAPQPDPTRQPTVKPLSPERYQIRFTAGASTRDKLVEAQDLLRHAVPSGDMAEIIDRALTLLLKELKRKKSAATDRPRASRGPAPGSRTVAARVQREVARRDDARCAYISADGGGATRARSPSFIMSIRMGWEVKTVDRTELRCRAHNEYEAELFYGRPWRERRTRPGTSRSPRPLPAQTGR